MKMLRCGQTPFVTIGFGLGESWEATIIQYSILKNRINGLGKERKTAIFPKLVFAEKDGLNHKSTDVNYGIKLLAMECAAKRMYPDRLSYEEVIKATGGDFKFPMGCRSFLGMYEEDGINITDGRFNMGVVTINLPRIALEAQGSEEEFYKILNKKLELCKEALLYRINRLKGTKAKVAPILYMYGACGTRFREDDVIDSLLEGGRASVSLGYIGVHETILALYGKHIFDDEELRKKGVEIVQTLRNACDKWKKETGYGFGLYGTPSESLCGRFVELDIKKFGIIKGVTDKDFYMNSFHLDVEKPATPFEKIDFECKYPYISSGGFINYVELNSVRNNIKGLEAIWDYAFDKVPYLAINTPTDKCFECGYEGEITATEDGFICPCCGNKNPKKMSVVRRVSGYLGEPSARPFAKGKMKETLVRVKHM